MCKAALLGLGVTMIAMPDALLYLERGELVRLVPTWYADAGPISIYYASRTLLPSKTRPSWTSSLKSSSAGRALRRKRRLTETTRERARLDSQWAWATSFLMPKPVQSLGLAINRSVIRTHRRFRCDSGDKTPTAAPGSTARDCRAKPSRVLPRPCFGQAHRLWPWPPARGRKAPRRCLGRDQVRH